MLNIVTSKSIQDFIEQQVAKGKYGTVNNAILHLTYYWKDWIVVNRWK